MAFIILYSEKREGKMLVEETTNIFFFRFPLQTYH